MEKLNSVIIPNLKCGKIIDEFELRLELPKGSLRRKTKQRGIARARHVTIHLCRKLTGRSYPQIAIQFGYADHTSVLYACEVAQSHMNTNAYLAEKYKEVEASFHA